MAAKEVPVLEIANATDQVFLAQYFVLATVKKMTNCSLCIFFASKQTLFLMCLLS